MTALHLLTPLLTKNGYRRQRNSAFTQSGGRGEVQKGEFEVNPLKTHVFNLTLESLIRQAWVGLGDVGVYNFKSTTDHLISAKAENQRFKGILRLCSAPAPLENMQ